MLSLSKHGVPYWRVPFDEPGADTAAGLLRNSAISAVNVSEVVTKLDDAGVPEYAMRRAVGGLLMEIVPFDAEQALQAGLLRTATRAKGLSLGDRACLGLAKCLGLSAVTADRAWARVQIGVPVTLLR